MNIAHINLQENISKKLPTKGKKVIQGPGENAGVIDIGIMTQSFLKLRVTIIPLI